MSHAPAPQGPDSGALDPLEDKLDRMRRIVRGFDRAAVAFSGGVDSVFLLKVCADEMGVDRVVAVTSRSASVPLRDIEDATTFARRIGVEHVLLNTDEVEKEAYAANPTNRCYFCKSTLYEHLEALVRERGVDVIFNGTNADDLGDHRPGLKAAHEHAVRAPIAEAGLTKSEVRALSRRFGLPTHDKPASPCLSSRVQYGERITPEKLRRIEAAETFLHELGIRECRVRHHDNLARIEVSPETAATLSAPDVAQRIVAHFKKLGYIYVTLDLGGFRSGSMNDVITLKGPHG